MTGQERPNSISTTGGHAEPHSPEWPGYRRRGGLKVKQWSAMRVCALGKVDMSRGSISPSQTDRMDVVISGRGTCTVAATEGTAVRKDIGPVLWYIVPK